MSTTAARVMNAALAMAILNSRQTLTRNHVGQQVLLTIQGNATFVSAQDQEKATPGQKQYFDKYIFNLKANSQEAIARKETRAILAAAIKAEGEGTDATTLFNEWLNACQVSFNVIADRARKFENGDMVTAVVGEAKTKNDHVAIVVNDVRYKAPASVEKIKFDLTDLMGDIASGEEKASPVADEKVVTA